VGRTDFLVVPLHFLALKAQIVVLVSFLFAVRLLTVLPRAQPFVKVGGRAPVPHGVGATALTTFTFCQFAIFHLSLLLTRSLYGSCSLRALYGADVRQNGIHVSSTCQEAEQEIRFFFHDSQSFSCPVIAFIGLCLHLQHSYVR